jgi:hypothetical protein
MRVRLLTSIATAALLIPGCSAKKQTEIVISVATDLIIPSDLNGVEFRAQYGDDSGPPDIQVPWNLDPSTPNHGDLPATIGLLPGNDLSRSVLITLVGTLDDKPVVTRQARLTFARDRIVLLHMNLLKRCRPPFSCKDSETCGENGCEPIDQSPAKLGDYSADAAAVHFLDARAGTDRPAPDAAVDLPRTDKPAATDRPKGEPKDGPKAGDTRPSDTKPATTA